MGRGVVTALQEPQQPAGGVLMRAEPFTGAPQR